MRVGRKVKEKEEPMKWVKQRAVTLQKRRQQELAKEAGEEVLQGLYSQNQTEIYRPPPIKDVSFGSTLRCSKRQADRFDRVSFRRTRSVISIYMLRLCCQRARCISRVSVPNDKL